MRKAILYLLLFSYTTLICKPVLPSLCDAIAHIFWYSEHMATVHYEQGKYHVHYEYQQAAKKEYPGKNTSLPRTYNVTSEHLAWTAAYTPFPIASVSICCALLSPDLLHTVLDSDIPPPKTA